MFINNSQRQVVPFASHREGSVGARPEIDWRRNHFDKDLFINEKRKCSCILKKGGTTVIYRPLLMQRIFLFLLQENLF